MTFAFLSGGAGSVRHSVFVRCAAIMALTTLVVAGVMAYQSNELAMNLARNAVVGQAAKAAPQTAAALKDPVRFKAVPKIEQTAQAALDAAGADGRSVLVLSASGEVLAQAGDLSGAEARLTRLGQASMEAGTVVTEDRGLLIAAPVRAAPEAPVLGAVVMHWSDEAAQAAVWPEKQRIMGLALGLFLVMQVLTTWFLRRSLGTPLRMLGEAVARIAQGDYTPPQGLASRRDEIGGIAARMGEMTDALLIAREAEQQRTEQHAAQLRVVQHLGEALDRLAGGMLGQGIEEPFPDAYAGLRDNYNRAADSLASAISEVRENAASIRGGADEIAQASDDLSRRTETQAATLEQTAAALEQLVTSVSAAAENAGEADKTVRAARKVAVENGSVMRSAVSAMAEIEKSSEQINDIIAVIDDIAFQTNLLALNAGVEAARAGSSGKGFAVVASEVRALAQRSSEAAQQIKELIVGSVDQVKHGVRLVERAGDALDDVVQQVGDISELVTGIADGSKEQAQGLNELNSGVANLDQVTQQNAAMVEQSTAAAHMLRKEAQNLAQLVARFETEGSGAANQPPAATGQPVARVA